MKSIFVIACSLFVISCSSRPADKFVGKWTDGTWRHIAITKTNGQYIVEDISEGHKKYIAKYFNGELLVITDKRTAIFNYIPASDRLFADKVDFHRE